MTTRELLETYADSDHPIRSSSFPAITACPARFALTFLEGYDNESGPAADTGTAAHLGIKLWHEGKALAALQEEVRSRAGEFPRADLDEAEKFIRYYTEDPRNYPEAAYALEMTLDFTLPPHPYDPTKKRIYCTGHLDQVRKDNQGYAVWDYKTGRDPGDQMLNWHMPQLAAYAYGAKDMFPEPPRIGGIIRGRGYSSRGKTKPSLSPSGVFINAPCSDPDDCLTILINLRLAVAMIRRGEPIFGPGEACTKFCPLGGMGACLPESRRYGLKVRED